MISLKQAYDLFLFDRESYCEAITVRNYRMNIMYFMQYMEGQRNITADKLPVNEITASDLKLYAVYLRNKDKYIRPDGVSHPFNLQSTKGITKRSVKTYLVDVRTMFNYLYSEEYIEKSITKNMKLIQSEKKLVMPLTDENVKDIDALYNPKTILGSRNLCIIHLLLDAGLRSSEMLNLKMTDINIGDDIIFVRQGKGSKDRTLPLAPKLKKYLYTYMTIYRPTCSHDFVICSSSGEPFTKDGLKSLMARINKKLDLSRLYPHLLRHTFATSYMLGGGDLETLRIYMGHTDISTTQGYLHIANQYRFHSDIYKLDKKFFKRYF